MCRNVLLALVPALNCIRLPHAQYQFTPDYRLQLFLVSLSFFGPGSIWDLSSVPCSLEARSFNHWATGEVPLCLSLVSFSPLCKKLPFLSSCQLPVHILVYQSSVQMLSFSVRLSGTSVAFGNMLTLQHLNIFQLLLCMFFLLKIVNSLEETPLLRLLLFSCS